MLAFTIGKPLPRHDAYAKQATARSFWRRAYWATHEFPSGVDAGGQPILPAHPRETDDRYTRRLSMSMARKYARAIVDRYNDHANRVPAKRPDVAGPYADLLLDATGSGMPLPVLMRRAMRWAQIERACYLLADANEAGVYVSAGQEAAAGKRGILRLVRADNVINWRDWQGQPVEALVTFSDRSGSLFAWYVTETFVQRIDYVIKDSAERVTVINEPQAHAYGGCPLVRNEPEADDGSDDAPLDSQCAPLADSMKRLLNIDSWLLEELQSATFTVPVFLGVDKDQVAEVVVGAGKALCIPGSGDKTPALGKLGADPVQAESLRTSIAAEIAELYRVAGLSPGNPTEAAQPESGVAKAFAFNEVEAKLSAIADATEHAENLAVRRLAAGFGWQYPGDADWPDSFATPDLAVELETAIRTVTSPLPQVLKDEQTRRYAQAAFTLSPEQAKALDDQLIENAKATQDRAADPFVNPPGRMAGS